MVANKKYADSKFVIIGKLGEGSDYLREIVENLRLEEYVSFVGSISEEDKISLLKKVSIISNYLLMKVLAYLLWRHWSPVI